LGATYKGKPIGSISDFTAFSFQAIKHLTTGDGGALCCLNKLQYEEAKKRRWFGIDRESSKPSILGERVFDIEKVGFKYHMNDLAAAVGLGNLEEFPKRLKKIREIASIYREELSNVPGMELLDYKNDRESAFWLFTVLVENRMDFIMKLNAAGIPVSVVHNRIDRYSLFGRQTPGLVNQENFDEHQIAIPIHSALSDEDIHKIINTIKR
jgi:perosamine synthetase